MIEIKVNQPITNEVPYISVSNEELIKGILAMPDDEFFEVVRGIVDPIRLDSRKFMILFAYFGNRLKKMELDPAQKNVIESYVKDYKL